MLPLSMDKLISSTAFCVAKYFLRLCNSSMVILIELKSKISSPLVTSSEKIDEREKSYHSNQPEPVNQWFLILLQFAGLPFRHPLLHLQFPPHNQLLRRRDKDCLFEDVVRFLNALEFLPAMKYGIQSQL